MQPIQQWCGGRVKGEKGQKDREWRPRRARAQSSVEMAGSQAGLSVDSGREPGQAVGPCTVFRLLDHERTLNQEAAGSAGMKRSCNWMWAPGNQGRCWCWRSEDQDLSRDKVKWIFKSFLKGPVWVRKKTQRGQAELSSSQLLNSASFWFIC